jgi:F-type H+-transporting ATPase subunit b
LALDVTFYTGLASALFYGLLIWAGGPWLVRFLRARQQNIVAELSRADEARAEVAKVRAYYESEKERVRAEASELLAEGKRDAAALREQLIIQAQEEIGRIEARNLRAITLAKQAALVEIYQAAADRSVRGAETYLKSELKGDHQDRLFAEALDRLANQFREAKA